jgi:hypothetical protein
MASIDFLFKPKSSFVLFLGGALILCVAQVLGSEEPLSPAMTKISEIHLAPGSRTIQILELIRQLDVSMLVDVGRNWKDPGISRLNYILWPAFSFKKGTIGEALDAFCKVRTDYQWDIWKEANVIWLEPKAAEHRAVDFYLRRPFKNNVESKKNETWEDGVLKYAHDVIYTIEIYLAWNETRNMPSEEQTNFSLWTWGNFPCQGRSGTDYFDLPKPEAFKDTMSFTQAWLLGGTRRIALLHFPEATENHVVELNLSVLPNNFSLLTIDDLVAGFFFNADVPNGYNSNPLNDSMNSHYHWPLDCKSELRRRYQSQPSDVLRVLKEKKLWGCGKEWRELCNEFITCDADSIEKFILDEFESQPLETKLKMIRNEERFQWFQFPNDRYYEKISHSTNLELSKAAQKVLDEGKLRFEISKNDFLGPLPIEDIIDGLNYNSKVPKDFADDPSFRRLECEEKLYPRYQYQPNEVLTALKAKKVVGRVDEWGKLRDKFMTLDADGFGKFVFDEFESLPLEKKLEMLRNRNGFTDLPFPWDYKGKFVDFYEKLSHSKDPELSKAAQEVLDEYKHYLEQMKEDKPDKTQAQPTAPAPTDKKPE